MKLSSVLLGLLLSLFHGSVFAEMLQASSGSTAPIGKYMQYFHERDGKLSFNEAKSAFDLDIGMPVKTRIAGFGLGAKPTWLKLQVANSEEQSLSRNLLIETSWLDSIEVYILNNDDIVEHITAGDYLSFTERPIDSRFFSINHSYPKGVSDVYIRISTNDPLTLPIYFLSQENANHRDSYYAYSYGILYGAAFSLLLYNLMLFIGMRNKRYLYFSFYLISFLIMNLSYTGHGFQWLWPDSPTFQRYSNPIFMMLFNLCGFLFAVTFLNIKSNLPKLYRALFIYSVFFVVLQTLSIALNNHLWSINLAFAFMLLFSSIMLVLGIASLQFEQSSAKYFLLATTAGVLGSSITASAVLGWITYTELTYRAVDIGIMLDMILLALALSEQFREREKAKIKAELLAQADPLTGLDNRHTFNEKVDPLWALANRNSNNCSIIIFDVDNLNQVNHYYHHQVGDKVLENIGQILKSLTRASDICARWEGDEFIVFSIDSSCDNAMTLAEKIREAIEKSTININSNIISVTASFGIACTQNNEKPLNQLITDAGTGLKTAKSSGGNQIHHENRG